VILVRVAQLYMTELRELLNLDVALFIQQNCRVPLVRLESQEGQTTDGNTVVSEPDPRKNQKEGMGDRLGQKCTVCPECRHTSGWFIIATRICWKYKPQPASTVRGNRNKQDLPVREVIGAQISCYWAHKWLEVPEVKWV